ncbi:hypothetical protein D1007_40437 [Hordeum vulgare]|nr:hypothetical protein D1007_40437 [Hordeum vulgare]
MNGKACKFVIDSCSCENLISQKLVNHLKLKTHNHSNPYTIGWIKKGVTMRITKQCNLPLSLGKHYRSNVLCDVVDMDANHLLLGRPWQFDVYSPFTAFYHMYMYRPLPPVNVNCPFIKWYQMLRFFPPARCNSRAPPSPLPLAPAAPLAPSLSGHLVGRPSSRPAAPACVAGPVLPALPGSGATAVPFLRQAPPRRDPSLPFPVSLAVPRSAADGCSAPGLPQPCCRRRCLCVWPTLFVAAASLLCRGRLPASAGCCHSARLLPSRLASRRSAAGSRPCRCRSPLGPDPDRDWVG